VLVRFWSYHSFKLSILSRFVLTICTFCSSSCFQQVADSNSTRLEWIIIWLITAEIVMGIAASPMFAGKRVATSLLVPTAILLFKRFGGEEK
jgi:predicted membrane protein